MDRLDRIEQALRRLKASDEPDDVIDLTEDSTERATLAETAPLVPATVRSAELDDWATDVVSTVVKTIWTSPSSTERMQQRAQRAKRLLGETAGQLASASSRPIPESSRPTQDSRTPHQG